MALSDTLHLRVITPERVLLEEAVEKVTFHGVDGAYGILPNHAPLMTALDETGLVQITEKGGNVVELGVSGGFAEVRNHVLTLVCEVGFLADEVSAEDAKQAEQEARERLSHASRKLSAHEIKAEAHLRKALLKEMLGRRSTGTGSHR